jgi:hypothetical protein
MDKPTGFIENKHSTNETVQSDGVAKEAING